MKSNLSQAYGPILLNAPIGFQVDGYSPSMCSWFAGIASVLVQWQSRMLIDIQHTIHCLHCDLGFR